ncbi:serine hydroxymethyltransferase [Streptomyces chrestomyceticus]|uniref:serine hydroxymethyltransferase n=1 Tax=Streptomyces chrestomyceticus TaxID=68185 RepID=UPI0035A8BDD2
MTSAGNTSLLTRELATSDPEIAERIARESARQLHQLELIAPKNYMSRAVFEAHSSIMSLTSVEGYPGRRMHAGMAHLDVVENLAMDRAGKLFGCCYANVQPHSGTQANQAVFFALLRPGDRVLSLALKAGGHLSHGLRSNQSGRWFDVMEYGVRPDTGLIDYAEAERLAHTHRPQLIITGGSSYPRSIDFARLRAVADSVGACFLADISHIAGLVAAGVHPSPFPHAHVVTSTTNKNLRGPRGGLILADNLELGKRLDRAVFPGVQGGPLPELICAKAVAFGEALEQEFTTYAESVLANARTLCAVLQERGYRIVTDGTDTPLVVVDLRDKGITGDAAERSLEAADITCNRNLVPGDPEKPSVTSGIRFGTSAVTTRGLRPPQMRVVASVIADVLDRLAHRPGDTGAAERTAAATVRDIAGQLPIHLPGGQGGN